MQKEELRKIPAVDRVLAHDDVVLLAKRFGESLTTAAVRHVLTQVRKDVLSGGTVPQTDALINEVRCQTEAIGQRSLKRVVNATGVILHTNLGRAPLGATLAKDLEPIVLGYSNLELDLKTGRRGQRNSHVSRLISFVTGADDAVVVNNNAAAVMLSLKVFGEGGEVIVSRGELIEIGGSFRMPDIMAASGVRMVEVGTTNRTRISDYEEAITPNTKILFKAHKSNFYTGGFVEEVGVDELSRLAEKHGIIAVYDLGSGLLKRPKNLPLEKEPDVHSALADGAHLVTFSGDKLLGGPQAGIIVGQKELVSQLAKAPMMRALRVGKMTLSALTTVVSCYLKEQDLIANLPIFELLNRKPDEIKRLAEVLASELQALGIQTEVVQNVAQSGGGTLPGLAIDSFAVRVVPSSDDTRFAEHTHRSLLHLDPPVLGILRGRNLLFDLLTVSESDVSVIAQSVANVLLTDGR